MFRRIIVTLSVGGVVFAAGLGLAVSQEFASGGVAAQGAVEASGCDDLSVSYWMDEATGLVKGVGVTQDPSGNCADQASYLARVYDESGVQLALDQGEVGFLGVFNNGVLIDAELIHHTQVTITGQHHP